MLHDFFKERRYAQWSIPEGYAATELDLGCGTGSFLVGLARRYPDRLILGADQLRSRLHKVERKLKKEGLDNARLLATTGWELIGYQLPDHCLDRAHVLCPDPWPKARHAPRRLLGSEFLGRLSMKLKPGAVLHIATDDEPYYNFIQEAITPLPRYEPAPEGYADVADLKTDFELLWESAGKQVHHVAYRVVDQIPHATMAS